MCFFSSRRLHTSFALVTGVQTCALPISGGDVPMTDTRLSADIYRDIAIIGIGETKVGKLPGYGPVQLQAMAAIEAVKDAGIGIKDRSEERRVGKGCCGTGRSRLSHEH